MHIPEFRICGNKLGVFFSGKLETLLVIYHCWSLMWILYEMDDSSCTADLHLEIGKYTSHSRSNLKKKKKNAHMFNLIYFLLAVVASTAVWAKGGNFTVSVYIMAGQSNLVSAHINKEKYWKHTHWLQGFSGFVVVRQRCCGEGKMAHTRWFTPWLIVTSIEKIQLTFSWF